MTDDRSRGSWLGRRRQWRLPVIRRVVNSCPKCGSEDVECTGRWNDARRPDAYYRCRECDERWRVRWVKGE